MPISESAAHRDQVKGITPFLIMFSAKEIFDGKKATLKSGTDANALVHQDFIAHEFGPLLFWPVNLFVLQLHCPQPGVMSLQGK